MTIVFVLQLSCYFVKNLSCWYEFYGLVKNTNDLKSIYITIFTEYKNQNMTFQFLHIHHKNFKIPFLYYFFPILSILRLKVYYQFKL